MKTLETHGVLKARRTPRTPAKNSLAIVERAFRGTIEEQYGHIVWLSGVMRAMHARHSLLLRGPAVLFAASGQPRQTLQIGDIVVSGLPHYESMVRQLIEGGGLTYVFEPDVHRYELTTRLMPEVTIVDAAGVVSLYESHHHVWYW